MGGNDDALTQVPYNINHIPYQCICPSQAEGEKYAGRRAAVEICTLGSRRECTSGIQGLVAFM
jgi:hypothetical protein